MSKGINKVILIGTLGKDPESKSFPNGGSITNVSVATNDEWRDKDGERQSRTEWHNVVFHNKLGEIAAQYLRKGSKVYIEGSLRTRKWQDKTSGQDRYTTEIHANEMQMLDGKPAGESRQGQGHGARQAPAAQPTVGAPGFEDDAIPFAPRHWKDAL